ncbi:hypothetical protein ACFV2N_48505 [Streptomyces sp. NPDC059680]
MSELHRLIHAEKAAIDIRRLTSVRQGHRPYWAGKAERAAG